MRTITLPYTLHGLPGVLTIRMDHPPTGDSKQSEQLISHALLMLTPLGAERGERKDETR